MRRIFLLLLALILFFSCNKARTSDNLKIKGTDNSGHMQVIPLRLEDALENIKLSELIDTSTLSVISLETTNESVFGSDIVCKISNGEIYIGDNQQKAILVFSETGKFRGKVGRQGRGPEEYTDLKDFIVQEDSIMILDYRRIMYYDKNNFSFIKSINLAREGIAAINMSADDSSYYFLNLDYSAIKSSMVICDKNFKVKAALRDPSYGKRPIFTMPVFFRMAGKMYYHHAYNDTLYHPTTEGLMAEYVWNCGERSLTLDQYQNLPVSGNGRFPVKRVPEQYFYKFAWYTYADSVLYFSGINHKEIYHVYYSLASGKARILNIKNLVDDIWGRNMKITPYASEEDYFYSLLSPRVFIRNGGSLTERPFAGHTEDDNPVILKFKYRKF